MLYQIKYYVNMFNMLKILQGSILISHSLVTKAYMLKDVYLLSMNHMTCTFAMGTTQVQSLRFVNIIFVSSHVQLHQGQERVQLQNGIPMCDAPCSYLVLTPFALKRFACSRNNRRML